MKLKLHLAREFIPASLFWTWFKFLQAVNMKYCCRYCNCLILYGNFIIILEFNCWMPRMSHVPGALHFSLRPYKSLDNCIENLFLYQVHYGCKYIKPAESYHVEIHILQASVNPCVFFLVVEPTMQEADSCCRKLHFYTGDVSSIVHSSSHGCYNLLPGSRGV